MAVSGTTTFTVTRDDIIKAALRGLAVLEEGATPTTDAVTNAAMSLNLIIKNLQKDGIKLWTVNEISFSLTSGKTTYTIAPSGADITNHKPLKLIQAWLRNTSVSPYIDIPLNVISKQEYNWLGSKFNTGTANSVFMDVGRDSSTLYVFLTPDTTAATNYQVYLTVQRQLMDVNTASDNVDFPAEWFLFLKWALMAELASDYDKPMQDRNYYDIKAKFYRDELVDWDVEYNSTLFIPDMRSNTRGFR